MANTWTGTSQGIAYALNKYMIDIFNAAASTRYIRLREVVVLNNSLGAVTGVILQMEIRKGSNATGGSSITPVTRDSSNSALNANTTMGTGRTVTEVAGALYRRFVFANEEPVVGGAAFANWLTLVPNGLVWPPSVGDANLQPLTMRASVAEGYAVKNITSTVVGGVDMEMHFTDEAT